MLLPRTAWDILSATRRRERREMAQAGKEIAAMTESGNGLADGAGLRPGAVVPDSVGKVVAAPEAEQPGSKQWTLEEAVKAIFLLERRLVQVERVDLQARATAQAQQSFQMRVAALDLAIKATGPGAGADQLDAMATGLLAWLRGQ
jgi:hypothetical protein